MKYKIGIKVFRTKTDEVGRIIDLYQKPAKRKMKITGKNPSVVLEKFHHSLYSGELYWHDPYHYGKFQSFPFHVFEKALKGERVILHSILK